MFCEDQKHGNGLEEWFWLSFSGGWSEAVGQFYAHVK